MFKDMTITRRITLICAVLGGLATVLAAVSLVTLSRVDGRVEALRLDSVPGMAASGDIRAQFTSLRSAMAEYLADQAGNNGVNQARLDAAVQDGVSKVNQSMAAYDKTITQEDDRRQFQRQGASLERALAAWNNVRGSGKKGAELVSAFENEAGPVIAEMSRASQQLADWNFAGAKSNVDQTASAAASGKAWTWGVCLVAMLFGSCLSWLGVRSITRAVSQVATELGESAGQVASAATQVSSSSQSLAQGASEQAASLEETSASSEEISSMTRKNAENSRAAAQHVAESEHKVAEANALLDGMVASMSAITQSSDRISKIIKVIEEIAFQTNILALNAAVEAARAGEAGMGFAVVADEVRNLAQRCAQAAKDITGMIEDSITRSNEGSSQLDQVASGIRGITASSGKVKALVDEVNTSSQEQARGIEEVARAVAEMEKLTQRTAANAEESASASEELSAQSASMRDAVDKLEALAGAATSTPPAVTRKVAFSPKHVAEFSLQKLGKAVGKSVIPAPAAPHSAAPAHSLSKESFPLDDDFKAF